jgi:hypothetical protein
MGLSKGREEFFMEQNEHKQKAIIDIHEEWPWYFKLGASIVNGVPVVIWCVFAYFALTYFSQNPELVSNRDMTLNISMWVTVWGVFSEVAFLTLVSWFFPYFSYKKLQAGTPIEKAACYIFWGFLALAGAMIISAGIR